LLFIRYFTSVLRGPPQTRLQASARVKKYTAGYLVTHVALHDRNREKHRNLQNINIETMKKINYYIRRGFEDVTGSIRRHVYKTADNCRRDGNEL